MIQDLYLGCFCFGSLFAALSLLTGGRARGHHQSHSHMWRSAHSHSRVTPAHSLKSPSVHHCARVSAQGVKTVADAHNTKGEAYINCGASKGETDKEPIEQAYFLLMGILNPMSISMAVFFFGASGLAILRYMPGFTPSLTYLPAATGAVLGTAVLQGALGWFADRLENSSTNSLADAIGTTGEVTVSIPVGKTGEVLFVLGQGRKNYSAKSFDPQKEIKRGTRVLIVNLENNVVYVDPIEELEPSPVN